MHRATARFGSALRPRSDEYRIAAVDNPDSRTYNPIARLTLVRSPDDSYNRHSVFYMDSVLLTAAMGGWTEGTTFRDYRGVMHTVRGREVYDAHGKRCTTKRYEETLDLTWRVVVCATGRYAQGEYLRSDDVVEAIGRGNLPHGSVLQAPREGELHTVIGDQLVSDVTGRAYRNPAMSQFRARAGLTPTPTQLDEKRAQRMCQKPS